MLVFARAAPRSGDLAHHAVGLRQYATQTNVYWNQILAASIAVSIPVVVGFLMQELSPSTSVP